jgi:prevent-host-death family protein
MIDFSDDIRSLTDFKRNTTEMVEQIEKSGRPMVLTVNGRAKLVVQDAESYQKMLDAIDESEAVRVIRRGLADMKAGRIEPVEAAFEQIRKRRKVARRGHK